MSRIRLTLSPAADSTLRAAVSAPRTPGVPAALSREGWLLAALIGAAVLTPAISVSSHLPDVRIEQVLALPALAILAGSWRRGAPAFRPGLVDAGFTALALATAISVLYAPAVLGERFSPRDGYEVVKLGLYWALFRFGLQAGAVPAVRRVGLTALLVAAAASALFGLAQYFDWLGVAERTGGWWAPDHHLRALARDGRAFGTVGNPNYFGALMALVAVVALTVRAWPAPAQRWERHAAMVALILGAAGVVLSGSRGALALLVVATATAWIAALALRYPRRALLGATALLAGAFVGTVALVEAFPRGRQDYLERVAGALSPTGDSDLALRLERWRGALGWQPKREAAGVPGPPVSDTGRAGTDAAAQERDARRKADVRRLVEALSRYRDATGALPAGPSLDALVPGYLDALPADPAGGAPYRYERTATGFTVAARIEDPADMDYPLFAAGVARNYMLNGDLEEVDGGKVAEFRALPGTGYRVAAEAALFGRQGIVFRGNPREPGRRAAVYQQRNVNRAGGAPFTASVWVKLPAPARGQVFLYTNVLYTDGGREDPYARVAADGALIGVWQRLTITVTPDPGRRVDFLGVYLLSDDFAGEAYADGFELVDGGVPVSFTGLPEAQGSAALGLDAGAQFRRSPVFGVGPQKASDTGAVDNEYLLVAAHYGLVGLAAYLGLWAAVVVTALRVARRGPAPPGAPAPAIAVVGVVAGLLVFNLVAGSLYHLQLMGVFWPVAGLAVAPIRSRVANA